MPTLERERLFWSKGLQVAGVDEAGRGAVAGPIVAAAVVLSPASAPLDLWKQVDDSKRLKPGQRSELAAAIRQHACGWSVASIAPRDIDRIGIDRANQLAMERALQDLGAGTFDAVLSDWIRRWPLNLDAAPEAEQHRVKKGDARHVSIAAASILAKVHRDGLMDLLHDRFPAFGFGRNRGYLTAAHASALAAQGPCTEHRMSFKPLADDQPLLSLAEG